MLTEDQIANLEIAAAAGDFGTSGTCNEITQVCSELCALRQTTEIAQADVEKYRQGTTDALAVIAQMHAAAVGDTNGPRAGWVEDIAMLRNYAMRIRVALDDAVELSEVTDKIITDLKKARDELAEKVLKYAPHDQITRQWVKVRLEVGNVEETKATQIVQA